MADFAPKWDTFKCFLGRFERSLKYFLATFSSLWIWFNKSSICLSISPWCTSRGQSLQGLVDFALVYSVSLNLFKLWNIRFTGIKTLGCYIYELSFFWSKSLLIYCNLRLISLMNYLLMFLSMLESFSFWSSGISLFTFLCKCRLGSL